MHVRNLYILVFRKAFDDTADLLSEKLIELDVAVGDSVIDQVANVVVNASAPVERLVEVASATMVCYCVCVCVCVCVLELTGVECTVCTCTYYVDESSRMCLLVEISFLPILRSSTVLVGRQLTWIKRSKTSNDTVDNSPK